MDLWRRIYALQWRGGGGRGRGTHTYTPFNRHPSTADTHDITDNSESPEREVQGAEERGSRGGRGRERGTGGRGEREQRRERERERYRGRGEREQRRERERERCRGQRREGAEEGEGERETHDHAALNQNHFPYTHGFSPACTKPHSVAWT